MFISLLTANKTGQVRNSLSDFTWLTNYLKEKTEDKPVFTTGVNWQREMLNFMVILEISDSQIHR